VLLLVTVGLAALTALAGPAPTAQAHAFLAGSNPSDGQVLAVAPSQLRLDFSESVVIGATRIDIVDATGRHITPTRIRLVTHGDAADTEQPVEVLADLPHLVRSSYRVSWETLSSDDLHSTSGVLAFGVGHVVTAGGLHEPPPSPVEAVLRWLILLGLSGTLGGALAVHLLLDADGPGASRAALLARRASLGGAVTGAGVAVILLGSQLATSGAATAQLMWSSYGVRWGVREAGLLLLVLSATARGHSLRTMTGRLLLGTGAAMACGGTALLGHSGAGAAPNITRIVAAATHLGTAATWSGCLGILAVVLILGLRSGTTSSDLADSVLRRFGPPAAVCIGAMVVTGVYLSSKVIGSVDAALVTVYGRTLLLKLALTGVAGSLALVNTWRLHGRSHLRAPRRTVVAEAVAALGVLALAAVLTSGQPAMEPQLVRSAIVASTVVDGAVADLQETVSISPNRPGDSVVLIDVLDTRRPSPGPVRDVFVSFLTSSGRGEPLRAEQLSRGRWSLATRLGEAGPIQVQVLVRRGGLPEATRDFAWNVGDGQVHTRPAIVSTSPVGGILERAAGVFLALVVVIWVTIRWVLGPWLRRRRREVGPGGLDLVGVADEGQLAGREPVSEHVS
jgi:copper transport protein